VNEELIRQEWDWEGRFRSLGPTLAVDLPRPMVFRRRELPFVVGPTKAYQSMNETVLIVSIDGTGRYGPLLHVSVSNRDRYPSWDLMIGIKRVLFPPDVAAAMIMPEEEVYVNISEYCLHIWELPYQWGLE
jgi:hypothetical protein